MADSGPGSPTTPSLRVVGFTRDRTVCGAGGEGPSGRAGGDPPAARRARVRASGVPDSPSALGRLLAREHSLPSLPSLTISTKGCRAPSVGLRTPASARSAGGGSSPNAGALPAAAAPVPHTRCFAAYRSVSAIDLTAVGAEALLSRSSDPVAIPLTARW
jgi:hypothetical protein